MSQLDTLYLYKSIPLENNWFCSLHWRPDRPVMPKTCERDWEKSRFSNSLSPLNYWPAFVHQRPNPNLLKENWLNKFLLYLMHRKLGSPNFPKRYQNWFNSIFELLFFGNWKFNFLNQGLKQKINTCGWKFDWKTKILTFGSVFW